MADQENTQPGCGTFVLDEQRPGIEILELKNAPGYEDETLVLENGLSNGLRFLVSDDETELAHFHINSPEVARLIARKLNEWSWRMADPPNVECTDAQC